MVYFLSVEIGQGSFVSADECSFFGDRSEERPAPKPDAHGERLWRLEGEPNPGSRSHSQLSLVHSRSRTMGSLFEHLVEHLLPRPDDHVGGVGNCPLAT